MNGGLRRLFLVFVLALFSSCGKPKQQLNVFIWSEYIDPTIVADFEKQFDCKVTIDLYEDSDSMIAKLGAGGASLYDIVVPGNYTLPGLIKRGLLAPLRRENIPNLKNLSPKFVDLPFNPKNEYGAPYQWGTTGIFIRKSKDQSIEETWGLLFDPVLQPGPFLLISEVRHCVGAALKYKGYSLNTTNQNELAQARELLVNAKRRSLGFEGTVPGKNRVLSKGARAAMVVNGDAARGMVEDPETYFFIPKEGAEIFLDILSIPNQAPHRDLAEKFINFILDPKIGARLSNYNQFGTPNQASLEFIQPRDLNNPGIYPSEEISRRLEYSQDLGEFSKLYDELWTQVKIK